MCLDTDLFRFTLLRGFPGRSVIKNPPANAGNPCTDPWVGRSPGGGNGNPLQYSCLENRMDRGVWWATVHEVAERVTGHVGTHTVLRAHTFFPF